MKVRDKTKNHTVNQKQAKNKTWIRHKKKLGKKKSSRWTQINKNRKLEKSWLQNGSWKKHEDITDLFPVPSAILEMQPRTHENEAGVDLR